MTAAANVTMMRVAAMAFQTMGIPARALVAHTLMARPLSAHAAALCVFGGLQVANFDVFLSCTHMVSCPAALG